MIDLVVLPQQREFGQAKRDTLPRFCLECDVRFACHGGCPKDRFTTTPDGEPGLHYLCPSYKAFFGHIRPAMGAMCELLRAGRAPSEMVDRYARRTRARAATTRARAARAANGSTATAPHPAGGGSPGGDLGLFEASRSWTFPLHPVEAMTAARSARAMVKGSRTGSRARR